MKAIRLHARGGPESLRFEGAPAPRLGPGEVLVWVRVAAVTPTELLWVPTWVTRDGGRRPLPVTPGHEFFGEVAALGGGRHSWRCQTKLAFPLAFTSGSFGGDAPEPKHELKGYGVVIEANGYVLTPLMTCLRM